MATTQKYKTSHKGQPLQAVHADYLAQNLDISNVCIMNNTL